MGKGALRPNLALAYGKRCILGGASAPKDGIRVVPRCYLVCHDHSNEGDNPDQSLDCSYDVFFVTDHVADHKVCSQDCVDVAQLINNRA